MSKANHWKHKKYKARVYVVSYEFSSYRGQKERNYVLTAVLRNGKAHNITYESHEAAKRDGWVKV